MRHLMLTLFVVLLTHGPAAAQTGPWNVADLQKTPRAEWLDTTGPLRRLLYESEPFQGKPTRVFAYYAEPDKIDGKLPAMVLVHGGGGKAFPEWAQLWATRGYIAIAMDLGGNGADGKRLPDAGPSQVDAGRFVKHPLKDMWSYHAVAAVIRAHSLLLSLPNVDPQRTGLTGISWGGYLTCIVAGLDDRFKVAVPVYGCGFIHENSHWNPVFANMPDDWRKTWIENFEPSKYIGQAKMPMLFVNGTNDFAYPLDSYQKSYRLVKNRNLSVTVGLPHGHLEGWAPKEIGLFVDQHLKGGEPLPPPLDLSAHDPEKKGAFTLGLLQTLNVKTVAVHYTADTTIPWQKRTWKTTVSQPMVGNATDFYPIALPKTRPLVYFVTITDKRGATVSSEHVTLE